MQEPFNLFEMLNLRDSSYIIHSVIHLSFAFSALMSFKQEGQAKDRLEALCCTRESHKVLFMQWEETSMSRSPSRAEPQGGAWFTSVIPSHSEKSIAGMLEFYASSKARHKSKVLAPMFLSTSPRDYEAQISLNCPAEESRGPQ